jgi:hypothetical protein
LTPTCLITQITPMREWLFLDGLCGEEIGVEELIVQEVRPILQDRYRGLPIEHIGDPNGKMREQSSSKRSAVLTVRRELGGTWRSGPVGFAERREPLRALLTKQHAGKGVIRVDRRRAKIVWQALRGGWHFHVTRTGVPGSEPVKDKHSHPGDAAGYGAAVKFPLGRVVSPPRPRPPQHASFFGGGSGAPRPRMPPEGRKIF